MRQSTFERGTNLHDLDCLVDLMIKTLWMDVSQGLTANPNLAFDGMQNFDFRENLDFWRQHVALNIHMLAMIEK